MNSACMTSGSSSFAQIRAAAQVPASVLETREGIASVAVSVLLFVLVAFRGRLSRDFRPCDRRCGRMRSHRAGHPALGIADRAAGVGASGLTAGFGSGSAAARRQRRVLERPRRVPVEPRGVVCRPHAHRYGLGHRPTGAFASGTNRAWPRSWRARASVSGGVAERLLLRVGPLRACRDARGSPPDRRHRGRCRAGAQL